MWEIPDNVFHQPSQTEEMGVLELEISQRGTTSVATRQYHHRALKVLRPYYLDDSGQVYYITINPGGGYVGGDSYRIDITVNEGASLLLTDQSATKVYRTPKTYVTQNITFTVDAGGVLEYIPDQMILYRDADFRQHLTAIVHPQGSLFLSDVITPGWAPDGRRFAYEQARLRSVVKHESTIDAIDNLLLRPGELDLGLGEHTHVASILCVDPAIDEALLAQVKSLVTSFSVEGAATALDRPGFMVRALGESTEELMGMIHAVADYVRGTLRGQPPLNLRQI